MAFKSHISLNFLIVESSITWNCFLFFIVILVHRNLINLNTKINKFVVKFIRLFTLVHKFTTFIIRNIIQGEENKILNENV